MNRHRIRESLARVRDQLRALVVSAQRQGVYVIQGLAWLIVMVVIAYTVFALVPDKYEEETDPALLFYISGAFTLSAIVMLVYTRDWNMIGRGLLATMVGDSLLYARAGANSLMFTENRDASGILIRSGYWSDLDWFVTFHRFINQHWVTDVVRSCFFVGATLLVIGVWQWVQRQRSESVLMSDQAPSEQAT